MEIAKLAWPLAGFAAITAALATEPVQDLDLAIRDWSDAHRPDVAYEIVLWLNRLGNGGPLLAACAIIAGYLAWKRRSAWPFLPVAAAFLLTGIVIQPLKLLFHRAAPHSPLPDATEVQLFSQDGGLSYPSGHAVNTIVWYGLIAFLLARPLMTIRIAVPVIVTLAGTYLGFHWLTDMLAGLCLGLFIHQLMGIVQTRTTRTPFASKAAT